MSIIALNWKWFVDKSCFLLDSDLESRSHVLIILISQVFANSWHLLFKTYLVKLIQQEYIILQFYFR